MEMMEACGFRGTEEIDPSRFFRKIDHLHTRSFRDIYFPQQQDSYRDNWQKASILN